MVAFFFRGRGNLPLLLLVLGGLLSLPGKALGLEVKTGQLVMAIWWAASGLWVLWWGMRSLMQAPAVLERPLRAHEWVFDFVFWKPAPFNSFLFVQMPWWSIALFGVSAWVCYLSFTGQ